MPAIITVILSWILLFFVFLGNGVLVQRYFRIIPKDSVRYTDSFWIGWAFTIFFLQVWNLFFPVGGWVFIIVLTHGCFGLVIIKTHLLVATKNFLFKRFGFLTAFSLMALWLANQATQAPGIYDNGLYHLNMIRWATMMPAVPGIGNLHARLALGPYFLYPAMLEGGFWLYRSHHIANGILILVLFAEVYFNIGKIFKSKKPTLESLFCVMILPIMLSLPFEEGVSSPSPDIVVFVLGILLTMKLFKFFDQSQPFEKQGIGNIFIIFVLAMIGMIIKLSFFCFWFGISYDCVIPFSKRASR